MSKPAPTPSDHTGPLRAANEAVVREIQSQLDAAVENLTNALKIMRDVEVGARYLNGTSATLKAKASEIEAIIELLAGEAEGVEKKMLGQGREPILERVDSAHLEKVTAARAESQAVPA